MKRILLLVSKIFESLYIFLITILLIVIMQEKGFTQTVKTKRIVSSSAEYGSGRAKRTTVGYYTDDDEIKAGLGLMVEYRSWFLTDVSSIPNHAIIKSFDIEYFVVDKSNTDTKEYTWCTVPSGYSNKLKDIKNMDSKVLYDYLYMYSYRHFDGLLFNSEGWNLASIGTFDYMKNTIQKFIDGDEKKMYTSFLHFTDGEGTCEIAGRKSSSRPRIVFHYVDELAVPTSTGIGTENGNSIFVWSNPNSIKSSDDSNLVDKYYYQIWHSTDKNRSDAQIIKDWSIDSKYAVDYQKEGNNYYWVKVATSSTGNNKSEFSEPGGIYIKPDPPVKPTSGDPEGKYEMYKVPSEITFGWRGSSSNYKFDLYSYATSSWLKSGEVVSSDRITVSGLTFGKYHWKVRAVGDDEQETPSEKWELEFVYKNNTPQKPTITKPKEGVFVGTDNVQFEWECSDADETEGDALTYELWMAKEVIHVGGNFIGEYEKKYETTKTTVSLSEFSNGKYFWKIIAYDKEVDGSKRSSQSLVENFIVGEKSLSVREESILFGTSPNNPETFYVSSNIDWTISSNVSWLDITPDYGEGNKTISVNVTSTNSTYSDRFATITVSGSGVTSKTISVTQRGLSNCWAPSNRKISNETDNSARLDWERDSDDHTYEVQFQKQGGTLDSKLVTTNYYDFINLDPNSTYEYQVRTNCGDSKYSSWSPLESFNTKNGSCEPPADLKATDGDYTDQIKIEWEEVSNATHYKVFRNISDDAVNSEEITNWISDNNYTDSSVEQGKKYYYWIKAALNSTGDSSSPFSNSDSGYASNMDNDNLALSSNGAIASSSTQGTYMGVTHYPYLSNDNDEETSWTNSWDIPSWLKIELKQIYEIDSIGILWSAHNQTFNVSLSEDDSNWVKIISEKESNTNAYYEGSTYYGSDKAYQGLKISPAKAKYIKVEVTKTSAPSSHIFKAIINEIKAFEARVTIDPQITLIPDSNFENELIKLGLDDLLDGEVLTASIDTVTKLNVDGAEKSQDKKIVDLTGIEDFSNLEELICFNNNITKLDLSKNKSLRLLYCGSNKLTALDVSKNIALEFLGFDGLSSIDLTNNINLSYLNCSYSNLTTLDLSNNLNLGHLACMHNKLTDLDVSNNPNLTGLFCYNNMLTSLDIKNNNKIYRFACNNNSLTSLDLRNGNNINFHVENFDITNNPNLACVFVDNVEYSKMNWTEKDNSASYVETQAECDEKALGIEDLLASGIQLFPNPVKDYLTVSSSKTNSVFIQVLGAGGEVLFSEEWESPFTNRINFSNYSNGLYLVRFIMDEKVVTHKVMLVK